MDKQSFGAKRSIGESVASTERSDVFITDNLTDILHKCLNMIIKRLRGGSPADLHKLRQKSPVIGNMAGAPAFARRICVRAVLGQMRPFLRPP